MSDDKKYLRSSWVLYDHIKSGETDYDKCTRIIGTFDNIESFWILFNNLYGPSDLFFQKEIGKPYYIIPKKDDLSEQKREISALSMFRSNILPKWEDPQNIVGGELSLKKFFSKDMSIIKYLDHLWLNTAMLCIGEQFTNSEKITGIRVVDSSVAATGKQLFRIEIWFNDPSMKDILENEFRSMLNLDKNDKISYVSHGKV